MLKKFSLFMLLLFGGMIPLEAGEWCPVGRPAVFQIQQTELPNAAYCKFLNACARKSDPFKLWNPLMEAHFWGGIARQEKNGTFVYSVKQGYEKLPATCMTWMSAARYCNWVSYGMPDTGMSILGTTEGDTEFGVYDTRTWGDKSFVQSQKNIVRKTSDAYFLPTHDEWRLAAYGKPRRKYPFKDGIENPTQQYANFYDGKWALPSPHLAPVTAYAECEGPWGTLNQGGNVAEWLETSRGTFFLAAGGSLIRGLYSIMSDFVEGDEPDKAISSFGIRLASAVAPKILPRPVKSTNETIDKPEEKISDYCYVGDVGNPIDPLYKKGRVNASFEIARFVLTNSDWCKFLNAVAKESDPHGLFNGDMEIGVLGGIEKSRNGYKCKKGWENRPVVYIGFHDVMRYCNWLHYGKTEGTDSEGSYDTRFCEQILSGKMQAPASYGKRNKGAKYWIPSDDEWYKAAYYDPTRASRHKYWDYPCRTSNPPSNKSTEPHSCNYLKDGVYLGIGAPYYLAEVQDYPDSDTYYGVRQMAGNVWEWVEPNNPERSLNLRGSSFGYSEFGMGVWNCDMAGYKDELNVFGARIARLPQKVEVCCPMFSEYCLEKLAMLGPRQMLLGGGLCGLIGFVLGALSAVLLSRRRK